MALNFSIPTKKVSLSDGDAADDASITIRGLSPSDIAALMREDEGAVIGDLYRAIIDKDTITPDAVAGLVLGLIGELPDMLAKIIARAADVPDQWELVGQIPLGTQYELLEAIGGMTFASESARKKLMALIGGYLSPAEGAAPSPAPHLQTSTSGYGASESR